MNATAATMTAIATATAAATNNDLKAAATNGTANENVSTINHHHQSGDRNHEEHEKNQNNLSNVQPATTKAALSRTLPMDRMHVLREANLRVVLSFTKKCATPFISTMQLHSDIKWCNGKEKRKW